MIELEKKEGVQAGDKKNGEGGRAAKATKGRSRALLFQSVCLVITRPPQIKTDVYDSRVPLNIVLQSKVAQRRQTNAQKVGTMQTQVVQRNPLG